jgi:hypothetical protein
MALSTHVHAPPGVQPFDIQPSHLAICVQLRRVKVDRVRRAIGQALGLDTLDGLDLLGDVVCGPAPHRRLKHVQVAQILLGGLRVKLLNLSGGIAGPSCVLFHLIFAGVGVGD